eukprot:6194217-Pleurochrysis_carterae.AAC.1
MHGIDDHEVRAEANDRAAEVHCPQMRLCVISKDRFELGLGVGRAVADATLLVSGTRGELGE